MTFVTAPFEAAAQTLARIHGIPDIPLVVVPSDYLENSEVVIRSRTDEALDQILHALFGAAA